MYNEQSSAINYIFGLYEPEYTSKKETNQLDYNNILGNVEDVYQKKQEICNDNKYSIKNIRNYDLGNYSNKNIFMNDIIQLSSYTDNRIYDVDENFIPKTIDNNSTGIHPLYRTKPKTVEELRSKNDERKKQNDILPLINETKHSIFHQYIGYQTQYK